MRRERERILEQTIFSREKSDSIIDKELVRKRKNEHYDEDTLVMKLLHHT